jgi:hypothetical protein
LHTTATARNHFLIRQDVIDSLTFKPVRELGCGQPGRDNWQGDLMPKKPIPNEFVTWPEKHLLSVKERCVKDSIDLGRRLILKIDRQWRFKIAASELDHPEASQYQEYAFHTDAS